MGMERRGTRILRVYRGSPDLGVWRWGKRGAMGPAIRSLGAGVRDQWNQQAAPNISGGRRVRIFVGRRAATVRARKYFRRILYAASVARNFPGVWIAVCSESRIQPGSRAGDCTDITFAPG